MKLPCCVSLCLSHYPAGRVCLFCLSHYPVIWVSVCHITLLYESLSVTLPCCMSLCLSHYHVVWVSVYRITMLDESLSVTLPCCMSLCLSHYPVVWVSVCHITLLYKSLSVALPCCMSLCLSHYPAGRVCLCQSPYSASSVCHIERMSESVSSVCHITLLSESVSSVCHITLLSESVSSVNHHTLLAKLGYVPIHDRSSIILVVHLYMHRNDYIMVTMTCHIVTCFIIMHHSFLTWDVCRLGEMSVFLSMDLIIMMFY